MVQRLELVLVVGIALREIVGQHGDPPHEQPRRRAGDDRRLPPRWRFGHQRDHRDHDDIGGQPHIGISRSQQDARQQEVGDDHHQRRYSQRAVHPHPDATQPGRDQRPQDIDAAQIEIHPGAAQGRDEIDIFRAQEEEVDIGAAGIGGAPDHHQQHRRRERQAGQGPAPQAGPQPQPGIAPAHHLGRISEQAEHGPAEDVGGGDDEPDRHEQDMAQPEAPLPAEPQP